MFDRSVSRRSVLISSILAGGSFPLIVRPTIAQTPAAVTQESITIDTSIAPTTLDPALARSVFDWSIIHSMYDSILDLSDSGELLPLATESFSQVDDRTFEVVLRNGMSYHDGSPVRAEAIARAVSYVQASDGPAARNFGAIERVDVIDDLTAHIVTAEPAPWLPSQLAVWLVLYPEGAETSFETQPIGSGPFKFVSADPGLSIELERNDDYFAGSPKGVAIANRATYRFVAETSTRIADLSTGVANIVDGIGQDQAAAVADAGGEMVEAPVLGISFLRMVNDTPALEDPRVRQAINHAIDVEAIAQGLVSPQSHRTASIFPDARSIGFDPDLPPMRFDSDLARALLADAGVEDGLDLRLEFTGGGTDDVVQAFAGYLAEVGINLSIETTELTAFNGSWQDPGSADLRFVTWRPVYDPHTLLSLMFASSGPLSRFADDEADNLIATAAREPDPDIRSAVYRDLGRRFQESPPAVFLWNLTAAYGVRDLEGGWSPRSDEYVIPTRRSSSV